MRFCKNSEESAPSILRRFCPHGESGSMNGRAVLARKGLLFVATLCAFFVGSENLLTSGAKPSNVLHETLEGFSETFGSVFPVPCLGRLAVPEALLPCQLILSKKSSQ